MANWIAPLADGDTLSETHYAAVTNQHHTYPIGGDAVNANLVGFTNVGALAGVTTIAASGILSVGSNLRFTGASLKYIENESTHLASYVKAGIHGFYWRRSDNGLASGPNETNLMTLDATSSVLTLGAMPGGVAPTGSLQIYQANTGGVGPSIFLNNSGATFTEEAEIAFSGGGSTRAVIRQGLDGGSARGELSFYVGLYDRTTSTGSLSLAMHMRHDGCVGVGVYPQTKLHIRGGVGGPASGIRIDAAGANEVYDIYRDSVDGILKFTGYQPLYSGFHFNPGGAHVVNITPSGVAIAGSGSFFNPAQKLHLAGGSQSVIRCDDTTNGVLFQLGASSGGSLIGTYSNHSLALLTNSIGRIIFHATGAHEFFNASSVPPTPNPGGGYLYVEAGALKWKGASGTVTVMGAA